MTTAVKKEKKYQKLERPKAEKHENYGYSLENLVGIKEAVAQVQGTRNGIKDLMFRDLDKFKVVTVEGTKSGTGYGLEVKGKVIPFTNPGIESLCKWLKMDFSYFKNYPNKQEFIEHVRTLLPGRADKHGALVRLEPGGSIRGVVPGNYTVLDDEQVLTLVGALAGQTLDQLKGVRVVSDKWDGSFYRLVFGSSALNRDEIYPVINIHHNEIGGSLKVGWGTLRIGCMNGSVATTSGGIETVLNWGHRGKFDKQVERIGLSFRKAGDFAAATQAKLTEAFKKELEHPQDELHRMLRASWITPQFHDDAEGVLGAQLSRGESFGAASPRTKYAVFNAMTETAKLYRPKQQAQWEAVAHNYLLLN